MTARCTRLAPTIEVRRRNPIAAHLVAELGARHADGLITNLLFEITPRELLMFMLEPPHSVRPNGPQPEDRWGRPPRPPSRILDELQAGLDTVGAETLIAAALRRQQNSNTPFTTFGTDVFAITDIGLAKDGAIVSLSRHPDPGPSANLALSWGAATRVIDATGYEAIEQFEEHVPATRHHARNACDAPNWLAILTDLTHNPHVTIPRRNLAM